MGQNKVSVSHLVTTVARGLETGFPERRSGPGQGVRARGAPISPQLCPHY